MRNPNLIQEEANKRKQLISHPGERSRCHRAWAEEGKDKRAWLGAAQQRLSKHDFDHHLIRARAVPALEQARLWTGQAQPIGTTWT